MKINQWCVIMQRIPASFICTMALLAFLMPAAIAEDGQNATVSIMPAKETNATEDLTNNSQNSVPAITKLGAGNTASHTTVLRAGFEMTKPLNNLDVYGNRSTHEIGSSKSSGPAFDLSQRQGNVSQFTYNTDIYKPIYSISQYSRAKPIYMVPDTLLSKPVYSISGYPRMMAVNSIP